MPALHEQLQSAIADTYQHGATLDETAAAYNVSRCAVWNALERRGIARRRQGQWDKGTPSRRRQAKALWEQGWSGARIARMFEVAPQTALRWVREPLPEAEA